MTRPAPFARLLSLSAIGSVALATACGAGADSPVAEESSEAITPTLGCAPGYTKECFSRNGLFPLCTCVADPHAVTLATVERPIALALDGTNVYWSDAASATIAGCAKTGCAAPTTFASSQYATFLAAGPTGLYWLTLAGNLMSLASGSGAPSLLASQSSVGAGAVGGIALDASYVYTSGSFGHGTSFIKVPLRGGAPTFFGSDGAGADQIFPIALAVTGSNVYWVNYQGSVVLEDSLAGGAATEVEPGHSYPYTASLAADSANLYWTSEGDGTVMQAPIGGGAPVTIASGQSEPFAVAVDSANVYFTTLGGDVMEVPIGGGAVTALAVGQANPIAIAVDSAAVYWANDPSYWTATSTPGSIVELSK